LLQSTASTLHSFVLQRHTGFLKHARSRKRARRGGTWGPPTSCRATPRRRRSACTWRVDTRIVRTARDVVHALVRHALGVDPAFDDLHALKRTRPTRIKLRANGLDAVPHDTAFDRPLTLQLTNSDNGRCWQSASGSLITDEENASSDRLRSQQVRPGSCRRTRWCAHAFTASRRVHAPADTSTTPGTGTRRATWNGRWPTKSLQHRPTA
jgi:hypothetical protein